MINKLHPLTITDNIKETSDFYKKYFGFEEVFTSEWYIQLAHKGGAEIAVMLPNLPNQPDFLHTPFAGKGIVFTFETEDATTPYEELQSKGVSFTLKLKDEEWGQRHFILKDPSGTYVDVVQYL